MAVDSATQAPIADVELRLSVSDKPLNTRSARTGTDGKARFDELPAGSYFLEAIREGYIDSKTSGLSQSVRIQDGVPPKEVRFSMLPTARVEGQVLDEEGRPIPGVVVHSMWVESTTDREGHYRLDRVRAGRTLIDVRVPVDLRQKTLVRDTESGARIGYPAVEYYPGVPNPESASMVTVVGGMDLHGHDIRLRRTRLADFSGRTVVRGGEALSGVEVELHAPPGKVQPADDALISRQVDGEGRFRFELIPPGSYVLMVYRGEGGRGLPYVMPVEVGNNGLDREIVVPLNQTIRGMVRAANDVAWSGRVEVSILSEHPGVVERDAAVRENGEFVLEDVPPGEWLLGVNMRQPAKRLSDQRRLSIGKVRFGVTDALLGPIVVVESGNPLLEIELTAEVGRIAGHVAGGSPGMVLVERVAPIRRYYSTSPFVQIKPDGSFLTDELPPGTYEVRALAGKAVRVEVKAGETATVEVPVK